MPLYDYKALKKSTGKVVKGVIDADSGAQARRKLREQELYPTDVSENTSTKSTAVMQGGGSGARGRISTRDLALMTRQFAVLLQAGMPMVESLNALIEQTSRPRLQAALYDVRGRVNSGSNLADAMGEQPRVFSKLYVNMVHAGEISGSLESVLRRLADILEHQAKLRAQILSSLAYPVFMGLFAFAVVIFLMLVIVPRITMIFEKQEVELPGITKVLIGTSNMLGNWWWLIAIVCFGLLSLWRLWISRDEGRRQWDKLKLRFPVYGGLHLKLVCARLTRTLGTMLESGLTMLPAMDVVSSVVNNRYVQDQLNDVKAGVRRGRDLAVPLKETGMFPPMMIHMIELGQRSGEIETMLVKVADTYDDDVRLTIEAAVGLLEPAIIIIMGAFVGFLVMAILLPILTMSQNI